MENDRTHKSKAIALLHLPRSNFQPLNSKVAAQKTTLQAFYLKIEL